MLKKILKKKQPTEKVGKSQEKSSTSEDLIPYVVVLNPAGEQSTELINRVTIGSEVGDLVIDHDNISPRHCTFFCNKGVFSVIDHASKAGTFVNKRKIEANRVYLLDERDKFRIGKLDVEIVLREIQLDPDLSEKNVNSNEDVMIEDETRELSPDLLQQLKDEEPSNSSVDNKAERNLGELDLSQEPEEVFSETEIREINVSSRDQDTLIARKMPSIPSDDSESSDEAEELEPSAKQKKQKKQKKKNKVKISRDPSTNAITRIIALISDLIICFIIVEVFSAFSEFKLIYTSVPEEILLAVKAPFLAQFEALETMYPSLKDLTVQVNGLPKTKEAFEFFTFFLLLKIVSSLIFSVSIGQALAGVSVVGNFLWKRVVSPFRIILGVLLLPFLIFDLPTIASKRSFKEVVTGTQFVTRGGIVSLLMKVFVIPLLLVAAMISPLYQGFEELPVIKVAENSKVVPPYEYQRPVFINALNITVEDASPVHILPLLDLKMKNKKEILHSGALIIDTDLGASYQIKKLKSFSFQELFESFVSKNPASPQFQPEIYGLVKNVANKNKNFDLKIKNKNKLVAEVIALIRDSFGVTLIELPDFVIANGVFIGAFRDFREKLNSLYNTPPEEMKIINLGGQNGIFASHGRGRLKHYTFIPLGELEGVMYKIEGNFNSPKSNKLKSQIRFGNKLNTQTVEKVADYINLSHKGLVKDNAILNQEIYERYFEVATSLVKKEDSKHINLLKQSLGQFINILNLDDKSNQKLTQNLTELLQALKDLNKEFFSISETEVI